MSKARITTFTIKIEKRIRDSMKKFCKRKGFFISKFIERAIIHEIKRERLME
jgi:hypothetical protein